MPSILFPRVDCDKNPGDVACEKPASASKVTPIVIGSIMGVVFIALMITLYMFHLRRQRNDQKEWPKDPQELDDYGFDNGGGVKPPKSTYQNKKDNRQSNLPSTRPQENPFGSSAEVVAGR